MIIAALALISATAWTVGASAAGVSASAAGAKASNVIAGAPIIVTAPESPYNFAPLEMYNFPERNFPITKYGAKQGDLKANIAAISKAMDACNKAGGGHVVVPAGEWLCGPVHFKSNCDLHLEDGAVLVFEDDPQLYLPAVMTAWEGMECMNYSPLVYAFECENVAITGKGKLAPKMDFWRTWFPRPEIHMHASRMLYAMASTDVPVEDRDMVKASAQMRPQLINFNRCTNVQLGDFEIYQSPFWTIHLFLCKDAWVHGINNYAHGHNSDGIDIEMTQHVLIEGCTFDQGDDGVTIKAGRNRDAWRLDTPTTDIVVRNCHMKCAGGIVVLGSELSGGIKRVYAHDCKADFIHHVLYIKTNERRGGIIEDITVENMDCKDASSVFGIHTDVVYQWSAVPTFEVNLTKIRNITLRNVNLNDADVIYDLCGDEREPIRNVTIENVKVQEINKYKNRVENVYDLNVNNVDCERVELKKVVRTLNTEAH